MKLKYLVLLSMFLFLNCERRQNNEAPSLENWSNRKIDISSKDSLDYGKSYLSIYSEIYSYTENKKHSLTSMVSLRNTNDLDTIYLLKAEYFDTQSNVI